MIIGSHISAAKGYEEMGKQALNLGATTFAFFTRNPRGGKAKELVLEDVEKLNEIVKANSFGKIVAHAPYTMNLCAAKKELREFAREMLLDDIRRMEYMPGNYYNLHPGSHVGQGADRGIDLVAELLNNTITEKQTTTILLETMSGKGTEVGRNFEELKAIIDKLNEAIKDRVGICLDTCHIWDGGYDIAGELDSVIEEFDKVIGIDKLKAIHLNDSMNDRGSHKDRHEKIGKGFVGIKTFENIVNHPALKGLSFILETPNDDDGWREEIAMLRALQK